MFFNAMQKKPNIPVLHHSIIPIARPGGSRQVVSEANEVLFVSSFCVKFDGI
jgi:hypothetical protein